MGNKISKKKPKNLWKVANKYQVKENPMDLWKYVDYQKYQVKAICTI